MMDKFQNLVTEAEDRKSEEEYITYALSKYGYPEWTFKNVKSEMKSSKIEKKSRKHEHRSKDEGLLVVPHTLMRV